MAGIPGPSDKVSGKFGKRKRRKGPDKVLIVLVAIVLIIILYALFTSQGTSNQGIDFVDNNQTSDQTDQNATDDGNETIDQNQTPEEGSEEYILGVAISNKNYTLCEELESKKQDCYEALGSDFEEACVKIENYEKKENCILIHVEDQNSTALCGELEEEDQLGCGLTVDPCYGKTNNERDICMALEYEDYGYCEEDECLYEYAEQKKDYEVCNLFENPSEITTCHSIIENTNKCGSELSLVGEQDYCYYNYGKISNKSYLCDLISMDSIYSYMCYLNFAIEYEDYSYCEQVGNLDDRWSCMKNYALTTEDIAGCVQIPELAYSNFESCYFYFAVEYSYPEACNKLKTTSAKHNCYTQAIMDESKPLLPENCANVTIDDWRDSCYKFSAKKNDDITICDDIEGENAKKICIGQFE